MWNYNDPYLCHYGVLGMKWGHHKQKEPTQNVGYKKQSRTVLKKKGESVCLERKPTPKTAEFLGKLIPKIKENQANYYDYAVKDSKGNTVGNATVNQKSKEEMNIVWVGINSTHEGNGYGQSVMRTILDDARKNPDIKKVTLEVPTNSPNARHIYEKLGFKAISDKLITDEDDMWGGLTEMELRI